MRVCQEMFPESDGFEMDDTLKQQLDIAIINVVDDWDFTILITGGGEVRVGKSVLAMQIAAYWLSAMKKEHKINIPFSIRENIVFNWDKLIEQGNKLFEKTGKYFPLLYDEAGETLDTSKTGTGELGAIRDYLRECGQYNSLNILVLPEFFTLPKGIALTRSTFLIDVYYSSNNNGKFVRGYFNFYSRKAKKKLYLNGKKELDYHASPYNFNGKFSKFYPFDEKEYRELKVEALRNRETDLSRKVRKTAAALIYEYLEEHKCSQRQVRNLLLQKFRIDLPDTSLREWIKLLLEDNPMLKPLKELRGLKESPAEESEDIE